MNVSIKARYKFYFCLAGVLVGINGILFGQDTINKNPVNIGIFGSVGLQKIAVYDWESRSDINNFPSFCPSGELGFYVKPSHSIFNFSVCFGYAHHKKDNLLFHVEAMDPIDLSTFLVYLKKDQELKSFNFKTNFCVDIELAKNIRMNSGLGINYYTAKLFIHYDNPPEDATNTNAPWITETKIAAQGNNVGFHGMLGIGIQVSKRVELGLTGYIIVNRIENLETEVVPNDGYEFNIEPEKRKIDFSGVSFNFSVLYKINS